MNVVVAASAILAEADHKRAVETAKSEVISQKAEFAGHSAVDFNCSIRGGGSNPN